MSSVQFFCTEETSAESLGLKHSYKGNGNLSLS